MSRTELPQFRSCAQAGAHGVTFNVPGYLRFFRPASNFTIVIFSIPERLTGTFQYAVSNPGRAGFNFSDYTPQWLGGSEQKVNVVRHDHPGTEFVVPSLSAFKEDVANSFANLVFFEPAWTGLGAVQLIILLRKDCPIIAEPDCSFAGRSCVCQTPGDEEGRVGGLDVRKVTAIFGSQERQWASSTYLLCAGHGPAPHQQHDRSQKPDRGRVKYGREAGESCSAF